MQRDLYALLAEDSGEYKCQVALPDRARPSVGETAIRELEVQVLVQTPPPVCCVTSGKSLVLSGPRFNFYRMIRLQ